MNIVYDDRPASGVTDFGGMGNLTVILGINNEKVYLIPLRVGVTADKDVVGFQNGFVLPANQDLFRAPVNDRPRKRVDAHGVFLAVDLEIELPGNGGGYQEKRNYNEIGFFEFYGFHITPVPSPPRTTKRMPGQRP